MYLLLMISTISKIAKVKLQAIQRPIATVKQYSTTKKVK